MTDLIQFYVQKKMTFSIPNLSTFFWVVATFFDKVARYEFGRLCQNGPEIAQSTRELASLDYVLFVTLCDYSSRVWLASTESRICWVTGMLTPHMRSLYHGLCTGLWCMHFRELPRSFVYTAFILHTCHSCLDAASYLQCTSSVYTVWGLGRHQENVKSLNCA